MNFIKSESLDLIEEFKYLVSVQVENGGSIKIEHVNSHLDSQYTPNYNGKLTKLKNKFPNNWELIIKGNCMADRDAKDAKYKYPEHKLPPSSFL